MAVIVLILVFAIIIFTGGIFTHKAWSVYAKQHRRSPEDRWAEQSRVYKLLLAAERRQDLPEVRRLASELERLNKPRRQVG